MQRTAITLFIAFELCFYLLIAQTGIVEYFSSNILLIAPLPIGGIIGSFFIAKIKTSNENKLLILLLLQLIISFLYPNLNHFTLFILGLSVGSIAPLMINEIKKTTPLELGFALVIAYSVGTYLFTSEVSQRGHLAIILTTVSLSCIKFLPKYELTRLKKQTYSLWIMTLWIFLDSALFETLSRDINISIWRDGYTYEIIFFHIIGIIAALNFKMEKINNEIFIIVLFALSYLFFFLREELILSIVYPFVISYYNVVILNTLIQKSLKEISIYMVFIGWIASGAGLFIATEKLILFVPIIFIISLLKIINQSKLEKKEIKYV